MTRVKLYNADGVHSSFFSIGKINEKGRLYGSFCTNAKIRRANRQGFYVKGQTTPKGVVIK